MSKGSTAKELLPVHLKPKEDELLSSWLSRLANAHGLAPNAFCSIIFPGYRLPSDVDMIDDLKILKVLGQLVGTSLERVVATTLSAYKDRLYESDWYDPPPWIMPVDFTPRNQNFGLQFCPKCLLDDEEPYFRRQWRLAFIILCERHLTPLLDSCSHCGSCITNLVRRNTSQQIQMLCCPSCKTDLRTATLDSTMCRVDQVEVEFQKHLMEALHQGWVKVPGNNPIYSHLYFKVVYALMKLLSVDMLAQYLRAHVSRHFNIAQVNVSLPERAPTFERLHIEDRRGLLGMARQMLEDWPDRFISFWASYGLSNYQTFANHISRYSDQSDIPFWCWKVLHDFVIEPEYLGWYEMYAVKLKHEKRGSYPKYSTLLRLGLANIGGKDLTNRQWGLISPLIPDLPSDPEHNGPPWRDSREVLNGVLWKLSTGIPWQYLSKRFPSWQTCFRRFQQWLHDGTLSKVMEVLEQDLEEHSGVDLSESDRSPTGTEKEGLLWVLSSKAKTRSSWFWQTLILFLSPDTLHLLHDMNLLLYDRLLGKE